MPAGRLFKLKLDNDIYVEGAKYQIIGLKRNELSIRDTDCKRTEMALVARAVQNKIDLRELDPYNVESLMKPPTPPPSGDRYLLDALHRTIEVRSLLGADVSSKAETPGGVTGRPTQLSVVEGQWPVLTGFGLLYSVPKSPGKGEARP